MCIIYQLCFICFFAAFTLVHESASVGFESLKYESQESSNVQVCLNVNGAVHSSFSVLINTRVGTAGESHNT